MYRKNYSFQNVSDKKGTFRALQVMYGTYEGVTLSGKPSGTT